MPARVCLFAILIAALAMLAGCAPQTPVSSPPSSHQASHAKKYTDKRLYRDITAEVARGASYYTAATSLQRGHGYPVTPGVTVRLPTLALIAAVVGWGWLKVGAFVLLAGAMLAWFLALRGKASLPERLAAAALIGANFGMLTGDPMVIHERWAGLFLTLALAARVGRRDNWVPVLALAGTALAVRELALPFALLALAAAAWERRGREVLAWAVLIAGFAGLVALHLLLVAAQVRPGDLASQGWWALGGPRMAIAAIVDSSPLQYLHPPLAAVLAALPLLGWLGLGGRHAVFCLALFTGYAVMFALFARPDNFYWGAMVQPVWFVGAAFLPRAMVRLARTLRQKRARSGNLAGIGARL
jgi:positive regulator of sigma E activity